MKVIKLRLYKGLKLLFNEQGKVENKNQSIKLVDGEEWLNYLSLIKAQGLCKVTLESVMESSDEKLTPVTGDHYKLIVDQLKQACGKKNDNDTELRLELPVEVKTDDEKIKDLAGKMGDKTNAPTAKKVIRDGLKARAAAGNLTFQPTMSNEKLEALLIEKGL